MSIIYYFLILLIHPYLAMWWTSFEKAGHKSWEALIPGYNYFVAFKIGCKKPWWALLLLFPGVHIIMWSVVNVSYIRRFGLFSWQDTLQGVFFPYIVMARLKNLEAVPETNWANPKEVNQRAVSDHIVLFLSLPVIGHVAAFVLGFFSSNKTGKKTKFKEWGDSILFALIAASIIRTYVFEPFKIPTGSMEKTLLVGDFLFVNKLAYGPKVPVTPFSFPLVHNFIPFLNIKSYLDIEKINYTRLPGIGEVERNDVVVFNYPSGDTAVYDPRMPFGLMGHDYHGIVINEAKRIWEQETFNRAAFDEIYARKTAELSPESSTASNDAYMQAYIEYFNKYGKDFVENIETWKNKARFMLANDKKAFDGREGRVIDHFGLIYRPVDKRENYIKRCVAIPGDVIEIKNSVLYVNGKKAFVAPNQNLRYVVKNLKEQIPADAFNNMMFKKYGLEYFKDIREDYYVDPNEGVFKMNLTASQKNQLKKDFPSAIFEIDLSSSERDSVGNFTPYGQFENLSFYPKDINHGNSTSSFEKITIPKKGATVKLTKENIAIYRRIITAYEGHTLLEKTDGFYIDNKKVSTYTFAMNYYWLMGDNRYNSADSRVWGFVPEDHIVGKASIVWFSNSGIEDIGIRKERIFKFIK
jgi:signal peptidase I